MKQRRMKYEVGGAAARVNVPHGSLDVINIPGSPCLDSIVTPFSAHRVSQRGRLSRIRGRRHVGEYAESVVFKIEISAYSAVFTFHRKYRCANNEKNHPRRIAAAESFAIRRPSTTAIRQRKNFPCRRTTSANGKSVHRRLWDIVTAADCPMKIRDRSCCSTFATF